MNVAFMVIINYKADTVLKGQNDSLNELKAFRSVEYLKRYIILAYHILLYSIYTCIKVIIRASIITLVVFNV